MSTLASIVVARSPGRRHPRHLHARSMDIFEALGPADRFLGEGVKVRAAHYFGFSAWPAGVPSVGSTPGSPSDWGSTA